MAVVDPSPISTGTISSISIENVWQTIAIEVHNAHAIIFIIIPITRMVHEGYWHRPRGSTCPTVAIVEIICAAVGEDVEQTIAIYVSETRACIETIGCE